MNEEKAVEVESTEASGPEAASSSEHLTFDALVGETAKLFEALGKAMVTAAQDVSNLMVVHVDGETRNKLDMLVDAGLMKSRREAANAMMQEGLKTHTRDFEKIARTKDQIAELRQQIRSLVNS